MSDVAAASTAAVTAPPVRGAWHNSSGFGFHDILDIINPLQHLPIIGSVYRWLTGDRPGAVAQIAGDALYGGPIGAAVGFVSTALEDNSGRDLGERVLATVFGSDSKKTQIAANTPPASLPPATPANSAATTGAISFPARPDHAPIPLFGGIAQPAPAVAVASSSQQLPTQQFLAQTSGAIRPASATPRATSFQPTKLVPLALPAGSLPAADATTVAVPMPPNPQKPVDISQKMLDALDKYQRLERERESSGPKPPASGVDLAL